MTTANACSTTTTYPATKLDLHNASVRGCKRPTVDQVDDALEVASKRQDAMVCRAHQADIGIGGLTIHFAGSFNAGVEALALLKGYQVIINAAHHVFLDRIDLINDVVYGEYYDTKTFRRIDGSEFQMRIAKIRSLLA